MTRIDDGLAAFTTETLSTLSNERLVEHLLAYKERYETLAEEFDDYKSSSLEMEQMLEKELEESQKETRSLKSERERLRNDLSRITTRYDTDIREASALEETLRNELASVRSGLESARARIRVLEQSNDDLERRERYHEQMLEDLTKNLEQTIERAAILESELAEQHYQAENTARMREEMRSERPRVAVEPIRMDRNVVVEHTPDETPEAERKAFASMMIMDDSHMEVDDVHPCTSSSPAGDHVDPSSTVYHHPLPPTPVSNGPPSEHTSVVPEDPSKEAIRKPTSGFTHSINRIVKDLLVRVDRVENILTTLKSTPR